MWGALPPRQSRVNCSGSGRATPVITRLLEAGWCSGQPVHRSGADGQGRPPAGRGWRFSPPAKILPRTLDGQTTEHAGPGGAGGITCPSALAASVKVFAGCRGLFSKSRPAGEPSADGGAKPLSPRRAPCFDGEAVKTHKGLLLTRVTEPCYTIL